MEGKLLESRLNSILEKEGFGVKSNKTNKNNCSSNNSSSYSTANGIFVSHYYIALELENEDEQDNKQTRQAASKEKQQLKTKSDDDSVSVSVWLWIIDMSAVGAEEQITYKVPLILQPHNAISFNEPINAQSSSSSAGTPLNTLTLSPKQGENSLSIISSAVDPFQVAVYSPKQIFSGHIAEFLAKLKTLQPKQPIPPLKLLRVEILVGKYSPSIISIKFHKLSGRHLAILTDDGFFTVFNVSDSLAYHEVQWNMQNIPRYGSENEFYLEETDQSVHFVDFEFGGSARFAVQNLSAASASTNATNCTGQLNQINDFDFLAVYFLTDSGKLYYQSPLILRDIRIDRDLLEQLGQYLLSEIDLVQQYEKIPHKIQALKEYLRVVTMLEKGDLLSNTEQPLQLSKKSSLDNSSINRKIPIFNTLTAESIKVQLQHIEIESGTQDQDSQQSSKLTRESELSRKWKQTLKNNSTSSSYQPKKRTYSQLSKVETFGGCLHVFILTKDANINNKNYATVQVLFSPLPAMPTHLIQEHYTFRLLKAEKARLQLSILPTKAAILGTNAQPSAQNAYGSSGAIHPRLISNSITQRSLDCVCYVLHNKVFAINFAWTQQLLDSYLEDPNILLPPQQQDNEGNHRENDNSSINSTRQQSSARVIVDLYPSSSKDGHVQFYAASQQDKTLLVIVPPGGSEASSQSFKLRCFSLDYLTNYIQIQASAKLLSSKISQLLSAAIPTGEIQSKEKLSTVASKQSQLEVNQKKLGELKQGAVVSLKTFETEASEFMKEHEKVVKHNIQLICERHAEVTKAKELLEKKKNEVETNILSVVARQREQLEESRKRIIKNNVNIQDKLCGIAGMIRQLNPSNDYVLSQQYNHDACNHAIQDVKEYQNEGNTQEGSEVLGNRVHNLYDRLQQLKVQYQMYFSKRQTFLEQVGQTALPENLQSLAVDQYLLDSAKQASNVMRKHAETLEEQIGQEKK